MGTNGKEAKWQRFLETNPWILGAGLSGQLLTAWEQTVAGSTIAHDGKRVDALMRTVGAVNSMVFAEIKHHDTDLLHQVSSPYRPSVCAPSRELAGGVTQIQQTVYSARQDIGERARSRFASQDPAAVSYLIRPRCYLRETRTNPKSSRSMTSLLAPSDMWRKRNARRGPSP